MKKILLFIFIFFSICVLVSCNKQTIDPGKDTEKADYTVMFYGVGGANLDASLYNNLITEVEASLSSKRLNFVGLAKFSKYLQVPTPTNTVIKEENGEKVIVSIADSLKGTIRVTKTYQGFKIKNYDKADLSFYKSETLTKFINQAVEEYPAQNYILVFWDHGSTFDEGDIVTKSMLADDNIEGQSIASIHDVVKGIKNSKIGKVSLVYSDMCLTNNIETLCEFSKVTDYYIGSANLAPGEGGNYTILLNKLINGNDFVADCKSYIDENVKIWDKSNKQIRQYQDMVISDLRKINPVVEAFKLVSARYIKLYQDKKTIKSTLDTMQLNGYKEVKFIQLKKEKDKLTGEEKVVSQFIYKWTNPGKFYFYDTQYAYRDMPVYTQTEPATLLNNIDIQKDVNMRDDWYTDTDLYASFATMNKVLNDAELSKNLGEFEAAIKSMIVHRAENYVPKLWDGIYHAAIGLKWVSNRRATKYYLGAKEPDKGATLMEVYPLSSFGQITNWHSYFKIYDVNINSELKVYTYDGDNAEPVFTDENIGK